MMNKTYIYSFIFIISFFVFCSQVLAAEIMQVSSSSVLLIGDNNRTYTVKIACVKINTESEEVSMNWLKKQLPRHTKVNLKPKGFIDGMLVARVIPINSNVDLAETYVAEGFAENKC